ncbi:type VI secretion system Vgr family protein [Paraburkholderia sp.]|uniref:type VI secretion system Vgr family protein n=1 Tax=Paraburkholderia sp. TaxID=1926495 RepID=UPI002D41FE90|nr:type VI secretion system tip protein TssI/VgrG [Paraburkholderia sp.]HZZ06516.1 type VI secretion system tip protein TssI/VgrG [Paraburkholderia sp.]
MNHIITAHTPLDPHMLRFRSLRGEETLSALYEFNVELVSPSASLDMNALLGKPLTLHITTLNGRTRFLGGQIVRCELAGRETDTPRTYIYAVTLRPSLWYLTKTTDCRIFQNRTALEIVREVIDKYGFPVEERLLASYRNWDYCVQYQESDFNFVSRLMEQEGIYYYFRHEAGQQVLVLADDTSAHDSLPEHATLPYQPPERLALPREEGIDLWRPATQISAGAYAVDDYDFRKPRADLSQMRAQPSSPEHGRYARYAWQGGYIEPEQGEHYARMRLEEEQAQNARVHAHTRTREAAPGHRFTLQNCPRQAENREYLLVGVTYRLQEGGYASGSNQAQYDFDLVAQPTSLPFRAPSITPVPRATGPQTAVVVGPAGQDLWTDQYGRVKVHFRWDRYSQGDENSSCWIRVSDAWAGAGFGAIHIPRIGQEVVVDFLNGALDRPVITGRIYNADQMPPFALPEAATQSGFVTRTPGGTSANANMLRFEDKQGAEQIALHAERDYDVSVENDATRQVGRNEAVNISNDATRGVGRDFTVSVGNDYAASIASNQSRKVGNNSSAEIANDETHTVGRNYSLLVTNVSTHTVGHSHTLKVSKDLTQSVGNEHSLSVASNSTTSVGADSTTSVAANATSTVGGNSAVTVNGSSTSVTIGLQTAITTDQILITGSVIAVTGSSVGAVGSAVSATGSAVSATGSSVSALGSSVSTTGSSVSSVGSSVSATGVSFATVGFSVTF